LGETLPELYNGADFAFVRDQFAVTGRCTDFLTLEELRLCEYAGRVTRACFAVVYCTPLWLRLTEDCEVPLGRPFDDPVVEGGLAGSGDLGVVTEGELVVFPSSDFFVVVVPLGVLVVVPVEGGV